MIAPHSMVAGAAPAVAQSRRDYVQLVEWLRVEAAAVITMAFSGTSDAIDWLKLPGFTRFALSRARGASQCNPLYRLLAWVVLLRAIGVPRERAQAVIDFAQHVVDMLWGAPAPTAEELKAIAVEEQRLDATEDVAEAEFLADVPGARRRWYDAIRARHAHDRAKVIPALQAAEATGR